MEWLKTILGDAWTEEIDKKVSEEIGRGFVARADFNTLDSEKKTLAAAVKERDRQLETLKAGSGDVEAMKQQIAALQADNAAAAKAHEAELTRLKVDRAVDLALSAAGAKNLKAVKALLELDKAEFLEDGSVKGLGDQIRKLAEAPDSGFLFGGSAKGFQGFTPGESGGAQPAGKAPSDMNYDELCAYLAENPGAQL